METEKTEREERIEYWDCVKTIALEAREQKEQDESDYIHQTVDGCYWVIYTHAAHKTMLFTENEDAAFEEGVDLSNVGSWSEIVTRLAYCAMLADVHAALDELPEDEDEDEDEQLRYPTMHTSTSYGPATEAYNHFALLENLTPLRGTVVMTGTAAEVWGAYHEHDDERLQIVGIAGDTPAPGDRIFHSDNFVSPDALV
jgi:hypothetical protein